MENNNTKDADLSRIGSSDFLSESEADKRAERVLLDYTASGKWDDMSHFDWTTSEVHGLLMDIFMDKR